MADSAVAAEGGLADLEIVRWRRYGKDRLYVSAEGSRVGWVDLLTGERMLSDARHHDAFTRAVNAWYADSSLPPQSVETQVTSPPATPTLDAGADADTVVPAAVALPWHDLATHVPGQAAREQAIRELAAMKERTKVGTFIARALDMKTDERAWRVGADGEETIGNRLDKLTKHGWHVLHAVPVGDRGSDIDHVVIGPGGVYTINTKRHPDGRVWVGANAIRVNGHSVPYLRNSRFEAERAGKLLSLAAGFPVPVRPVLAFLTGTVIPNVTIKQQPADVLILDRMDIPGVFKRAPQRMSAEQVGTIYEFATRCTTWTRSGQCRCAVPAA
jgi:hypothetical protein